MDKQLTPDIIVSGEKARKSLTRPLMTFGFTFFFAMIIASFIPLLTFGEIGGNTIFAIIILVCFFSFLTLLLNKKTRTNRHVMTVAFAVITAFSIYFLKEMMISKPVQRYDGETKNLTVQTLDTVKYRDNSAFVTVKIVKSEGSEDVFLIGKKATFWFYGNELSAQPYDEISGNFNLAIPSDSEGGEARGYSKSRDIYLNLSSGVYGDTTLSVMKREGISAGYLFATLKSKLITGVMSVPGNEDVSGLMVGIAIGDKGNISGEIVRDFRVVGASHILAVSGLHTSLIAFGIYRLLTLLKAGKRLAPIGSIVGVIFFMALSGFSQSVVRSGIMSIIFMLGIMIDREADGLNSLGFSVLIICLFNPYAVHDVGLLLSFGATYGIIAMHPYFKGKIVDKIRKREDKLRYLAPVVDSFFVTLSATLPLVPILILTFGTISVISPITNLFMIFPSSVVMVLTLVGGALMLTPLTATFGEIILRLSGIFAKYLCLIAKWFSKIPYAELSARNALVLFFMAVSVPFLFICIKFFGEKGKRYGTVALAVILVCGSAIRFVALSDATAIKLFPVGNGTAVLISDGSGGHFNGIILMGERTAIPSVLRELNKTSIKRLDFIVVDGNSDICTNVGMIMEVFDVGEIITCSGGKYLSTLNMIKTESNVVEIDSNSQYCLDEREFKLSFHSGVVEFSTSGTRFIVFPTDACIDEDNNFDNSVGIFTVSPPKGYKSLNLLLGVVNCKEDKYNYVKKAFDDIDYPVLYTAKGATNRGRIFGDGINVLVNGKGGNTFSVS